jgi:hypothetical protein
MSREVHVRFFEGLRVQLPWATHLLSFAIDRVETGPSAFAIHLNRRARRNLSRSVCIVTQTPFPFRTYAPVGVTALLILWMILVSPYSKYADMWAIGPALLMLPLVVGLHLLLAYKARWSGGFVAYALVHCALFFAIWIGCLMAISKDSI